MKLFSRFSHHRIYVTTVWNTIKTNWIINLTNKFVLVLFSASILLIIWRWNLLPPFVPLWYSRPWGTDQLAHPLWLFLLPCMSLGCYIVNRAISIYITSDHLVFTQILFISSLFVSVLSFIALSKIIFLVT